MLQARDVDIDQFIRFNAGGVIVADYDQIQAALIKKYKETYGYDIDLANTTADGIFVNNLALIINNILQSFKTLYANLDVETASGAYLDSLCRLSNVTRKRATQSTAQLLITSTANTVLTNGTIFIDTTGNEWVYDGNDIQINTTDTQEHRIVVTCTQYGPIEASAGSITQTLEATFLVVTQPSAANVGSNDETDEELRARRDQSNGSQGVTVLESLVGALLAVDGIEDAQVISNNTNDEQTQDDGTVVSAHNVYVILRRAANIDIQNSVIGTIIYNTLTPGIGTTIFTGSNGVAKSYDVQPDPNIALLNQTISWKEATPIHPQITVKVTKGRDYTDAATTAIGNAILEYLNNIKLSTNVSQNDLLVAAMYADTTASFVVSEVNVSAAQTNKNTYYKYIMPSKEAGTIVEAGTTVTFTFNA